MHSRVSIVLAQLSAVALGLAAAQVPDQSLTGYWAGEVHMRGEWQFATLRIEGEQSRLKGTLELLFAGRSFPVTSIQTTPGGISFTAKDSTGQLEFSGFTRGRFLEGSVRSTSADTHGDSFAFAHLSKVDLTKYTAAYEDRSGVVISLSPIPDESLGPLREYMLQYTNTRTGRFGALFSIGDNQLIGGGPALRIFPVETEVSVLRGKSGDVTALTWRDANRPILHAGKDDDFQQEQVQFGNGGIRLAGTLTRPRSRGPHPAVVFTHGSGPQHRQRGVLEQLFVRAGFAVLTYDKRGVGESTGNWREASFKDLAGDAVAGALMLQERRDVDETRIGFWGLSQGAWIAPLAAAKFGQAAFVIAASGGGLSPERQELLDTEYRLQMAGFSAEEIAEAMTFQRAKDAFMRTGDGWRTYQAMRERAVGRKWYGYGEASGPASAEDPFWARQRRIYFYEPGAALKKLTCDVLFVFGALDTPSAVRENVSALQLSLAGTGHRDVTIRVVPNAGHNLFIGEADSFTALTKQSLRYAAGYPQAFVSWAKDRIRKPRAKIEQEQTARRNVHVVQKRT